MNFVSTKTIRQVISKALKHPSLTDEQRNLWKEHLTSKMVPLSIIKEASNLTNQRIFEVVQGSKIAESPQKVKRELVMYIPKQLFWSVLDPRTRKKEGRTQESSTR